MQVYRVVYSTMHTCPSMHMNMMAASSVVKAFAADHKRHPSTMAYAAGRILHHMLYHMFMMAASTVIMAYAADRRMHQRPRDKVQGINYQEERKQSRVRWSLRTAL